jgi:hypothetical protein
VLDEKNNWSKSADWLELKKLAEKTEKGVSQIKPELKPPIADTAENWIENFGTERTPVVERHMMLESDIQKVLELEDATNLADPETWKEPNSAPATRSFMLPVVGTFSGIAVFEIEGLDPNMETFEDLCKLTEMRTSKEIPLHAKLLTLIADSEIQSDLDAAVNPARYAGVGVYTPNAAPLI